MATYFQHIKTGHVYKIVGFGLLEWDLTPMVYDRRVGEETTMLFEEGPVWARPCEEFFDGRFVSYPQRAEAE